MTSQSTSSFFQIPRTKLGWWAIGLLSAFVVMFAINAVVFMQLTTDTWWQRTILPFYGILMIMSGLFSGIVGFLAVIKKHEHSWMVWLSLLPGAFVLFLVLGEFLVPH